MNIARWLLATICLALVGCETLKSTLNRVTGAQSTKEKEIAALKAEYEGKIAVARNEVSNAKDRVIAGKDAQMDGAATALYGQDRVFRSIITPTRTDLIFHNLGTEAWGALGNRPPTAEGMKLMNERLSKELDETKTSLAQLQANHNAALAQNQALADQSRKHEKELKDVETKLSTVEREGAAKVAAKQNELLDVQKKIIALEKERANDREAIQALKIRASTVLGLIGLMAIAAAIYLPVFKTECGAFGGICMLAAVGVWFIQPWMIAAAAGVAVLGVIGWMATKYRKEERVADALVLATQDIKEKASDVWESHVKPAVTDRLSRYRKTKGGKFVTESDPNIETYIDRKLVEYDHLPSKPRS